MNFSMQIIPFLILAGSSGKKKFAGHWGPFVEGRTVSRHVQAGFINMRPEPHVSIIVP